MIARLSLIGLLPLALTGCFGQNNPTFNAPASQLSASVSPALPTLLTTDAKSATADLIAEYQQALASARQWHADAKLYAVTVEWPPTLLTGLAKRVYVFGSAADHDQWWTLAINEQTKEHIRSYVPKSDYLGYELQPVSLAYWKINAVQALQIADANGGKDFRAANPGSEITESLAAIGPKGWLWWTVNYRGENNAEKHVIIHPSTGVVYDTDGDPVGASADTLAPSGSPSASISASPTTSPSPAASSN